MLALHTPSHISALFLSSRLPTSRFAGERAARVSRALPHGLAARGQGYSPMERIIVVLALAGFGFTAIPGDGHCAVQVLIESLGLRRSVDQVRAEVVAHMRKFSELFKMVLACEDLSDDEHPVLPSDATFRSYLTKTASSMWFDQTAMAAFTHMHSCEFVSVRVDEKKDGRCIVGGGGTRGALTIAQAVLLFAEAELSVAEEKAEKAVRQAQGTAAGAAAQRAAAAAEAAADAVEAAHNRVMSASSGCAAALAAKPAKVAYGLYSGYPSPNHCTSLSLAPAAFFFLFLNPSSFLTFFLPQTTSCCPLTASCPSCL